MRTKCVKSIEFPWNSTSLVPLRKFNRFGKLLSSKVRLAFAFKKVKATCPPSLKMTLLCRRTSSSKGESSIKSFSDVSPTFICIAPLIITAQYTLQFFSIPSNSFTFSFNGLEWFGFGDRSFRQHLTAHCLTSLKKTIMFNFSILTIFFCFLLGKSYLFKRIW